MAITGFWTEGLVGSPVNMNKTLLQFATLASRDAAADEGIMFLPTDEDILYRDNGSTWDKVAQMIGISSGDRFIDTEDGGLLLTLETTGQPATPDGQALQIWRGTAGAVTAETLAGLIIEDDAAVRLAFLVPDSSSAGIAIGSPTDGNNRASFIYDGTNDLWITRIDQVNRLHYGVAAFRFQEATVISTTSGDLTLSPTSDLVLNPTSGTIELPATAVFGTVQSMEWDVAHTVRQRVQSGGTAILCEVENTSTTTTNSRAKFRAIVKAQSTGDPTIVLQISATQDWNVGIDNSSSDRFSIGEGEVPGTTDAMRIAPSTRIVTWDDSAFGADFDYACDRCGRHALESFTCCGKVEWHDDVLALREMILSSSGLDHMVKLGVMHVDDPNDSDPGWIGINLQPAIHMTWAGMWQNREYIDQVNEKVETLTKENIDLRARNNVVEGKLRILEIAIGDKDR